MVFKLLLFQKVPIQLNLIIFLDNINKSVLRNMLKLRSVLLLGVRGPNFKEVRLLPGFSFLFFAQASLDATYEVELSLLLGLEVLRTTIGSALGILRRIDRSSSRLNRLSNISHQRASFDTEL